MNIQQAALSPGRARLTLATLFIGMFVLGSAELLVVGVLDLIAADLQVSIPAAGTLVTAYAAGLALGGPILTALTIKLNRRSVLIGALLLFALANLPLVLINDYGLFLAARVVAGALQGVFIGAAFTAGIAVVPPERIGRAMSVVISGVAVSAALGSPLGTLVGQALGWRGSFAAVVGLTAIALLATLVLVPSVPSTSSGAAGQAKHAFAPRVLAVLGLTLLIYAALYAALTYLVPFLQGITGISGALLSVFLLAYGAAAAAGSFSGGRFADTNAARTLIVGTAGVAVSLLALYLIGDIAVLAALGLMAMGLFVGAMTPSLQYRVMSLAGPGGALAQSLPASAVNVGIAFGSTAGGLAIGGSTASSAVLTGLIIAVIVIPVAWATSFLKPPAIQGTAGQTATAESSAPQTSMT